MNRWGVTTISDDDLTGHLSEMLAEWAEVREHQGKHGRDSLLNGKGDNTWWINQECYFAERFAEALIDELRAARGLPPRVVRK